MEHQDSRFENVAAKSSMADKISVRNMAIGDFDNDGWLEIFLALAPRHGRPASNRLFKVSACAAFDGITK